MWKAEALTATWVTTGAAGVGGGHLGDADGLVRLESQLFPRPGLHLGRGAGHGRIFSPGSQGVPSIFTARGGLLVT